MRAVALSNEDVQKKVAASFIPLKITIPYGTEKFPVEWPALKVWQDSYKRMGGSKTTGLTACSVVSPDLQTEFGSSGSAFVWEMFDSIAYNADKFSAMLDTAARRADEEQTILNNKELSEEEREKQLTAFRKQVKRAVGDEGKFHLPPKGFTIKGATKLFEMTGDIAAMEAEKKKAAALKDGE